MDYITSNCYYRVSVKALILNETKEKFLICLTKKGKWSMLGGGLEWGETTKEALQREIKEESGLEILSMSPNPTYIIPSERNDGKWAIDLIYEVVLRDLDLKPSDECLEVRFISKDEIKQFDVFKNVQEFAEEFEPNRN